MRHNQAIIGIISTVFIASFADAGPILVLQEAINRNEPPTGGHWSNNDNGWKFTATRSYQLTHIETKFLRDERQTIPNPTDGSNPRGTPVDVEIWTDVPIVTGATKLAGGQITPEDNQFVVGQLSRPVEIVAGKQYFIGFMNLRALTVNGTGSLTGVNLNPLYFSRNPGENPKFSNVITLFEHDPDVQPILGFYSTIPEPSTALCLTFGIGALMTRRRFDGVNS